MEQIKANILKHKVKTNSDIYKDLDTEVRNTLDTTTADLFISEMEQVDLELLQLKIKRGYPIHDEAEHLMNIIQKCQNKQSEKNEYFVVDIYDMLRRCMRCSGNWVCYNCGNENLNKLSEEKDAKEIAAICTLCGMNILSSINLSLKGNNTYTMVKIKQQK
eukprot:511637_1